jgi:sulfur-oxidizing protein SoxZ
MTVRALITVPPVVRPSEVIEIRTLIAHPMETGHRSDGQGGVVPRLILRRFTCRLDGQPVFSAELHATVAANPLIAFPLRVQASGTLECRWEGDDGFAHTQTAALRVA